MDLDDNWDDVRYVEHEGAEEWAQSHRLSSKSEFAKRLRAEAKAGGRAAKRFEQRFKSSHLKASPHAPASVSVEEETANDVLRNLAFEDLEEQATDVHTPETPQQLFPLPQRTPVRRSEPRRSNVPRTPQYATPSSKASPPLCSSLMADRPSHWNTVSRVSKTPAPARVSTPFQTPDARIAKKAKAQTDLIPSSLSSLRKRKRMPPSQGMSFRPSWLSQPTPTAVEEVVDDFEDDFGGNNDVEAQQPLLQHAAASGGTPQANRRRGRKGGELETKLGKIRTRLARDHAAFRSSSLDPSASTVLDVIHPRSRAKYAVDVTIVEPRQTSDDGVRAMHLPSNLVAARDMVELVAFVHRTLALKPNRGGDVFDEQQSSLHSCQYDGAHVSVIMAASDVRRHGIQPGVQLRFYDCVLHPGTSQLRPLMLCTTLFEPYREEFGTLSEPLPLH